MFQKILCLLGLHSWKHIFLTPFNSAPKYRYCSHCKRCEQNNYNAFVGDWFRIEDIKDNSQIEQLERIFNNS